MTMERNAVQPVGVGLHSKSKKGRRVPPTFENPPSGVDFVVVNELFFRFARSQNYLLLCFLTNK